MFLVKNLEKYLFPTSLSNLIPPLFFLEKEHLIMMAAIHDDNTVNSNHFT